MNSKNVIKTNIGEVCTQSLTINRIIWKINLENFQKAEATKHACKNCTYFDSNGYLPCAVNPCLAAENSYTINDCRDFDLKP